MNCVEFLYTFVEYILNLIPYSLKYKSTNTENIVMFYLPFSIFTLVLCLEEKVYRLMTPIQYTMRNSIPKISILIYR